MLGMWREYHPRIPWLLVAPDGQGGFYVNDTRSGQQVHVADQNGVHQFAADHSSNGGGLGDLVHRAASAVGAKRCAPCAQRQAVLNSIWSPFD
jgi:hypothetical protein